LNHELFLYVITLVMLGGLVLTLVGEIRDYLFLKMVFKPIASLGFLLIPFLYYRMESLPQVAMTVALIFSFFGDVLLIFKKRRWFLAGLFAFLMAHVSYGVTFAAIAFNVAYFFIGAMLCASFGWFVWRWLHPHVNSVMRVPVLAYISAIMLMLSLSIAPAKLVPSVFAGAVLFMVSDLFVARQRFVVTTSLNRIIGLPIYYLAQFLLATSLI